MHGKVSQIKDLIESVFLNFSNEEVKVKDYWDADSNAIGFVDKTEKYLVYVSINSEAENNYFISLEYPTANEDSPYEQGEQFDNINFDRLKEIITNHIISRS